MLKKILFVVLFGFFMSCVGGTFTFLYLKSQRPPKVYETEIGGKPFTQYDDTVIAFGAKGEELFRTKVEEPFLKRPDKHINWV